MSVRTYDSLRFIDADSKFSISNGALTQIGSTEFIIKKSKKIKKPIKFKLSDIKLLGKYNKNTQKGIRILFVPLSWITRFVLRNIDNIEQYNDKIKKFPLIEADLKEQELFSVKIN